MMANILYHKLGDGIYHITLNRVSKHNAIDEQMALDILNIVKDINKDPERKMLILSANGPNFCAGADLNWVKAARLNTLDELLDSIMNLNIITAVYVQGKSIGGAVGLISVFDFAFASKDASFLTPEVSLGIVPKVITPYLVRAIGLRAAKSMLLLANEIPIIKAMEINLITETVDDFKEHQHNLITETLKKDRSSIKVTKELLLGMSSNKE